MMQNLRDYQLQILVNAVGSAIVVVIAGLFVAAITEVSTRWWIVALPLLSAALTMAGAIRITRRPIERIEQVILDADSITVGEPGQRIHVPVGPGPISRLADAMNSILERIERSSEQQKRFVSNASHELKSPITAILSNAELALSGDGSVEELREAVEISRRNAERLAVLVDDLLSLAILDERRQQSTESVDLVRLVEREVMLRRRQRNELEIDFGPIEPRQLTGHPNHISWAVGTVLDNAIRYARSRIQVTIVSRNSGSVVIVDDDGPGIDEDDRLRLTERFETGRDERVGGAGLGLSIARSATEAHGGGIWISESPLGGARVELGFADDGEAMANAV